MSFDIITHSDMWKLQVPEQLFSYADAYRSAAVVLCQKMKSDATSRTWPNAAVVLMLAAHAVELFLKGAVFKRNPSANFKDYGHSIDDLSTDYRSLYPEPSFKWDIPFSSGLTEEEWMILMRDLFPGLTEAEMARIKGVKEATPDPSILYRCPVQKGGAEWPGLYGFEPHSFLLLLGRIESDFARIKSQMA